MNQDFNELKQHRIKEQIFSFAKAGLLHTRRNFFRYRKTNKQNEKDFFLDWIGLQVEKQFLVDGRHRKSFCAHLNRKQTIQWRSQFWQTRLTLPFTGRNFFYFFLKGN